MFDYMAGLGTWNWFILGVVLIILEVLVPGTFMLWLGISALAVGVIALAVTMTWQVQVLLFAILSIASVFLWRKLQGSNDHVSTPTLNRRGDAFIGRTFTLEKPIVDGLGSVRAGDGVWMVRGPDTPAGSRVKVVSSDGGALTVAPEA
ncbi:inner membrane protein YbbJ [Variibacter gotjawalensis]|uniref:Inner membrane protein YbbJ n=1 Tax=Variibacter gotjawalensis TaxID=1333996 RepID=A0A0S3PVL5_9BRAD|nr:NfeD family protein [Variibacter gotjawalensis]NIK45795.1 hypothetical protein [Variibacter gotjawalensis]RZS47719.1 hypothetical protein EV661_0112 [Variibacter gotjawalensis]BAT59973.1 inner membrane protein YbbJ [Variibacter gotjawalensis]